MRNICNLPKVSLTVKPDPHDALSRSLNGNLTTYNYENYGKNDQIIYANGQQQVHQDQIQQQYAVVKKSSSKRELNNMQRDNPAIFKVNCSFYYFRSHIYSLCTIFVIDCIVSF